MDNGWLTSFSSPTVDYTVWNPLGWMTGNPIIEEESKPKRKKKKKEENDDENNPPSAVSYNEPSIGLPPTNSWLSNYPTTTRDYQPVQVQGNWASRFARVEDPRRQFNHGNGAWGTFGFRRTGHLAEAYKSPFFNEIRKAYGNYNDFWNAFTRSGYSSFSNDVDSRYEQWLKQRTGNDINKAARFNLTGSMNPSKDWMVGKNMSWQSYSDKIIKGEDGTKMPTFENWLNKYNLQETPDYNLRRAYELGYVPDETGHLPSVDEETGEWLKAYDHPTRGMELMEYMLNPELNKEFQLIKNENGNLQYIPKYEDGGTSTRDTVE